MKTIITSLIVACALVSHSGAPSLAQKETTDVVAAREARDRASIEDLQPLVKKAQKE